MTRYRPSAARQLAPASLTLAGLSGLLVTACSNGTFAQDVTPSKRSMDSAPLTFPGEQWSQREPAALGLDKALLEQFAQNVGGDGCIIRNGYLVMSWGNVRRHQDWASAAKPVLSTLLLLAVQEGRVESVDSLVGDLGWPLSEKDSTMTYRHLANMVSGYGLEEPPGQAWGYNDFAIQLYAKSLEKIFAQPLDEAFRSRMQPLELEGSQFLGSRNGLGVNASVVDFARLGWLWLHRGNWNGKQIIDRALFDDSFQVGVPAGTVRAGRQAADYLKLGSYGGGTNQTASGPGVYGFNLWFNKELDSGNLVWPALPEGAYQANGMWNRDTVTMIPSWNMVIAVRAANPGKFEPGSVHGQYHRNLQLIAQAVLGDAYIANANQFSPIDLRPFGSCISHWRNLRNEGRFITVLPDQPSYKANQVREIADNILLYQRSNGGWPKDYDMTAILSPEQRKRVLETRDRADTSYDNNNLFSQVNYLAQAYTQVPEEQWRVSCERGIDFMLESQYANGGFPQGFPNPHSYHAHITFNDGVMIGALRVLKEIADGAPQFLWVDDSRRRRAQQAVQRGVECILQCQIQVDGKLTGWCQQHDEVTFEPRPARTFELASLCPQETTEITRFLMTERSPSPETVVAIEAAIEWLGNVRLESIRVQKIAAPVENFVGHDADFDVVVVEDSQANPIWARHYEIGTDRSVFAGRNAIKVYQLSEIERERRTGTKWYGDWPARLLDKEYPQWVKQRQTDAPQF